MISTVTVYKPQADPWHAFTETGPIGDVMVPGQAPYSISKIAEEAVARYGARAFDLPITTARMGSACDEQGGLPAWHLEAITAGHPLRTRWDPMPYSPIHDDDDDDIAAQLEPLLDAATVPATIVNWCGDQAVSVQQWSAYFGELLGVEAQVDVTVAPGASIGSVGDHHARMSITGPWKVEWREGFRRLAEQLARDRALP